MKIALKTNLIFLGLVFMTQSFLFAQDEQKDFSQLDNILSFEIVGHTIGYSINYERIIFDQGRFKTTNKIGFAYYGKGSRWFYSQHLLMPLSVNQLFQTKPGEFAELGIGILFLSDLRGANRFFYDDAFIFKIGYRFQNPSKRFLANIGYTPVVEKSNFYHSAAAGIGVKF